MLTPYQFSLLIWLLLYCSQDPCYDLQGSVDQPVNYPGAGATL